MQLPPGVAALDADLAATTSSLTEAAKVHGAAEAADTLAAEKISAFRPRHQLLTLRQQWDDLARTGIDLPALEAEVTGAVTAHGEAKRATEGAEQHTELFRVAAEHAADAADRSQQAVILATEQTATLATITIPHDLDELTTALTALRTRHAELDAETNAAEEAYRAAQAALGSAPSEATLTTDRRSATIVHDALTADLAAWNDRDQAADAVAAVTQAVATAADALATARANLDAARLADEAGDTARSTCAARAAVPGLCEQVVKAVPAGHDTSHVADAEKELASAQSRYGQAVDEHARLDRDHRDTAAARAETLRHLETARIDLHTALHNLPGPDLATLLTSLSTPTTPDTARGDLTRAADAAAQASHIFDARCRKPAAGSNRQSPPPTPVAASASAARRTFRPGQPSTSMSAAAPRPAALQRTRDTVGLASAPRWSTPLISLPPGTPSPGGPPLNALPGAHNSRRCAKPLPTQRQPPPQQAPNIPKPPPTSPRLRDKQNTAATDLARITQTRDQTAERQQNLSAALTAQPSGEQVAEFIAELDRLDQAAGEARGALTEARQARIRAQQTVDELNALARDSRTRLATMRDPLTRYGAPAIAEDTLAAAWNQLDNWARTKETTLTGDMTKARNAADHAAKEYQAAVAALSDALVRAELPLPDLHTPASELHTTVTREVAGAAASARIAAQHAADRFHERQRLHKQKEEVAEQAQVSQATLANLLRSDAFQAWLLESALCVHLVADASDLLLEMSSGLFELRIQIKDIDVFDHNDDVSTRPVRTPVRRRRRSKPPHSHSRSPSADRSSSLPPRPAPPETRIDLPRRRIRYPRRIQPRRRRGHAGEPWPEKARMVGTSSPTFPLSPTGSPSASQVTRTGARSHIERITAR